MTVPYKAIDKQYVMYQIKIVHLMDLILHKWVKSPSTVFWFCEGLDSNRN